ncbi:FixH family protein [Paenibacillus sp. GCM10027626]|uniref:FixH family protein n=1 Tax=Paenibacillus sp. GCM10027626 TaxID=3273411 RepID=UPI003631CE2B
MKKRKRLSMAIWSLLIVCTATFISIQLSRPSMQTPPTVNQTVDGITAKMTFPAYPAKRLQPNVLTIELVDEAGSPASGYTLSGSLSMPDMACGTVPFTLQEVSPGHYEGSAMPLMLGVWEASISAKGSAAATAPPLSFSRRLDVDS